MRLLILTSILSLSLPMFAVCTAPAGVAGQFQWFTVDKRFKGCDGSVWWTAIMGNTGSPCGGIVEGQLLYISVRNNFYTCVGTWEYYVSSAASVGDCTGLPGKIIWDAVSAKILMCGGNRWQRMY